MKMPLAALHESAIGPTQTSGDVRYRIALGGQADINRPSQFMSTRPRPSSTTGSTMGALDQSAETRLCGRRRGRPFGGRNLLERVTGGDSREHHIGLQRRQ
jgi:hypothetical protein